VVRYVTYVRYEPYLIAGISGYEFLSLVAHRRWLPTITTLVRPLPRVVRWGLGVAGGVFLVWHFGEER
jgi:hypothetical protein